MVNVVKQDKTKNKKTIKIDNQFYVSVVPEVTTIKLPSVKSGSQSSGNTVLVK